MAYDSKKINNKLNLSNINNKSLNNRSIFEENEDSDDEFNKTLAKQSVNHTKNTTNSKLNKFNKQYDKNKLDLSKNFEKLNFNNTTNNDSFAKDFDFGSNTNEKYEKQYFKMSNLDNITNTNKNYENKNILTPNLLENNGNKITIPIVNNNKKNKNSKEKNKNINITTDKKDDLLKFDYDADEIQNKHFYNNNLGLGKNVESKFNKEPKFDFDVETNQKSAIPHRVKSPETKSNQFLYIISQIQFLSQ